MISIDTIGNDPCQLVLCEILIRIDDDHLTHRVFKNYERFRKGLIGFSPLCGTKWHKIALQLWRQEQLKIIAENKHLFPIDVYTHMLCCITALYRKFLQSE